MSRLSVIIGFLIIFAGIFGNAFQGTQISLIGIGFILLGLFIEVRKLTAKKPGG